MLSKYREDPSQICEVIHVRIKIYILMFYIYVNEYFSPKNWHIQLHVTFFFFHPFIRKIRYPSGWWDCPGLVGPDTEL